MTDNLGGHPLAHLALGLGVDRQDKIGMGLNVDKARSDSQTGGSNLPRGRAGKRPANVGTPAISDRHVGRLAWPPGAVDYRAAADQDVPRHGSLPFLIALPCPGLAFRINPRPLPVTEPGRV